MFRKFSSVTAFAFFIAVMFVGNTLGCACCSEPGTHAIWTGKIQDNELEILKQIRLDKRASLFMTEAGFDTMKGLSSIEKDFFESASKDIEGDFDLVNAYAAKVWTFTFRTAKGQTGSIRLPMPTQMTTFKADIHDGSDKGLGPLLYKEYRFKGTVAAGTGFLGSAAARPTTYFLVFQGRGLACDDIGDFRNWNLEIVGPKADYQFYGRLESAKNEADPTARAVTIRTSLLTLQ
jgi:hypothetical protein